MEQDDACNSQTPAAILLAILLFWGVFIPIAAFCGTKSTWYDTWNTAEQIDSWVAAGTLYLAAGTIFLAWLTSRSVEITARVLKDEQVRHQQAFAPLVKFIPPDSNTTSSFKRVKLENVGNGLALNVTARFSIEYHLQIDSPPGSTFSEGFPEPSFSALTESYDFEVVVSVVDQKGRASWDSFEDDGGRLKKGEVFAPIFKSLIIEYKDMFGNGYETHYAPGSSTSFKWIPPPNLQ